MADPKPAEEKSLFDKIQDMFGKSSLEEAAKPKPTGPTGPTGPKPPAKPPAKAPDKAPKKPRSLFREMLGLDKPEPEKTSRMRKRPGGKAPSRRA